MCSCSKLSTYGDSRQVVLPVVKGRTNHRAHFWDPIAVTEHTIYCNTKRLMARLLVISPDESYGYRISITVPETFYGSIRTVYKR